MHERGEALDFDERMALADWVYGELREQAPVEVILNIPLSLKPLRELQRTGGRTGDCGVRGILGMLGTGDIVLCGIGRTIPELVYGKLGEDRIRDIWLHHPRILELRRVLDEMEDPPGICGECVFIKSCRTGCVAQNYADSGQLMWPNELSPNSNAVSTKKRSQPKAGCAPGRRRRVFEAVPSYPLFDYTNPR